MRITAALLFSISVPELGVRVGIPDAQSGVERGELEARGDALQCLVIGDEFPDDRQSGRGPTKQQR